MNCDELKKGKTYIAAFRDRFGRAPVTYLGPKNKDGSSCFVFYDGICEYKNIHEASERLSDRMCLMYLSADDVSRYINAIV